MIRLEDIKSGDVLTYWHDDNWHGQLCYVRVIRVGRVFLTVETEHWGVRRKLPQYFTDKVRPGGWHPWHTGDNEREHQRQHD